MLRKSIQTGATRRYWAKGHRGWHLLRMQPWARPEIGRLAQGEEAGNFRRQPIRQHRRRRSAQNGRETHEKGCFTGRRPLDGIDTRKSFMATQRTFRAANTIDARLTPCPNSRSTAASVRAAVGCWQRRKAFVQPGNKTRQGDGVPWRVRLWIRKSAAVQLDRRSHQKERSAIPAPHGRPCLR